MSKRPTLVILAGPTAIGKTGAAIRLAQTLNTEIISSDSRQFYRELAIGTAKPTPDEQALVKHHFVDTLSIFDTYSAGDFERDVLSFLEDFFTKHQTAIMVGGSGLFIKAVTRGLDELPSDQSIRSVLIKELEQNGIAPLQEELKARDPEHFGKMDIMNPQRLIRALEVCRVSNQPYSSLRRDAAKERPFNTLFVGLNAERQVLYNRINNRVEKMMSDGLEEEARRVYPHRALNSLKTVGYKELFNYFDGEIDRDQAVAEIKKHTRNFAKRQLTWFRKNTSIKWFDYHETDRLIAHVQEQIIT